MLRMRPLKASVLLVLVLAIAACSHKKPQPAPAAPVADTPEPSKKRRYSLLEDQGPDQDIDVTAIPNATPKKEPITIAGNMSPYTVLGKTYRVNFDTKNFKQTGLASWYGKKFHGERTSNGEIYNMFGMTAAHKTLPIPCYVRVTNLDNAKSVILRVNDRGPFHGDRIIDLTYTAAKKLGYHAAGVARVQVDIVNAGQPMRAPSYQIVPVAASPKLASAPLKTPPVSPKTSPASKPTPLEKPTANLAPSYLQVGSFGSQTGAETLQKTLSSLTHYPVVLLPVPNKKLVRVLVGPFTQSADLEALKNQLIAKNITTPYVVQGIKPIP